MGSKQIGQSCKKLLVQLFIFAAGMMSMEEITSRHKTLREEHERLFHGMMGH